jgi:predicted CopG family antitoxin
MGTKTISLEDSAYEKLRGAKRPGESFSDVVKRILGGREPSFSDFRGLVDRRGAKALADAVAKMREEDVRVQRGRQSGRR